MFAEQKYCKIREIPDATTNFKIHKLNTLFDTKIRFYKNCRWGQSPQTIYDP